MRKFIFITIFSFLFTSYSIAEVIILKKCYAFERDGKKTGLYFNNLKMIKSEYSINTNTSTVVFLNEFTEQEHQKRLDDWKKSEYYKEFGGVGSRKITTAKYTIDHYDDQSVYASRSSDVGKSEIRVNIFNGEVFLKMTFKKPYQVLTSIFKCEPPEESSSTADGGSSGTAFFVSAKGHLLTNNHVVEGCKISKISYLNKDYDTKLLATDKTLDLALLKTNIKPKSYFNFSKNGAKKLNKIYVAGYPLGKGLSDDLKISSGIVSSLKGFDDNSNEIQIDAPINPGNSGGPIINENGDLVAIAVSGLAKDQTEGINFGIKSSAAELFLKSNNINPKKSMYSGIKDNNKLLKILEDATVYTYCD